MNVFGIGLPELAVIAAIGLLVFGPKRLPELGKTLGKTLKGFQSASSEFEKEFRSAITTLDVPVSGSSVANPTESLASEVSPAPQAVTVADQLDADQRGPDQAVDGPAA